MKNKHGLHSIGKEPLPSSKPSMEGNSGEDYKPGSNEEMSHIESMVDDMSPEEQSHAHKHLTHKLKPNKMEKPVGEDINDFASKDGMES